jgi:hypothetical protein
LASKRKKQAATPSTPNRARHGHAPSSFLVGKLQKQKGKNGTLSKEKKRIEKKRKATIKKRKG